MRLKLTDPWGRPRALAVWTAAYFAWSLLPVLFLIRVAFDADPRDGGDWSFVWFRFAVGSPTMRGALLHSLTLAWLSALVATLLGVGLGIGLARWGGPLGAAAKVVSLLPLATPQVVMATAFFIAFLEVFHFIALGSDAQLVGHVTIALPFVTVITWGRLLALGKEYEEMAMDLGASPARALLRVVLPLLAPAIFAAASVAFVLSFDNIVISQWICIGLDCRTLPMLLYRSGGTAPLNPAVVALGLGGALCSLAAMALFVLAWRWATPASGRP